MSSRIDYVVVKKEKERKERRQKLIDEVILIGSGLIFYTLILKVIL